MVVFAVSLLLRTFTVALPFDGWRFSGAEQTNSKLFPEAMLGELRQKGCTGLAGVPSTYQILLRRSGFTELVFPRLRWFPNKREEKLPNPCIQQLLDSFPQVKYFLMYGQTEGTSRLSYLASGANWPTNWVQSAKACHQPGWKCSGPTETPVAPGSG